MNNATSSTLLRAFLWLTITLMVFYILRIGKELIIPLVLAIFIWYLINALSAVILKINIKGRRVPASLRYIASGAVIAGAMALVFNFITQNVNKVIQLAPIYQDKLQPLVDKVYSWLPFEQPPSLAEFISQFDFSAIIKDLAGALASLAGNAGIILIYLLFLFLEQRSFGPKIKAMAKSGMNQEEVTRLLEQIDRDTRLYIGIKTLTSALTGVVSYLIMASVNLDLAGFWAMLIFFLNFIPTIGSIVATFFPAVLALVAFESPFPIAVVIGGIIGTQVMVGSVIEPRLMGNSLNLSPLVILLSLGLWGTLWGVPGMFLCVPITVIGMIICSHFPQTRPVAILLSGNGRVKGG